MKVFIAGVFLIVLLSGCSFIPTPPIGASCFNITQDYALNENTIVSNSSGSSCTFVYSVPFAISNSNASANFYTRAVSDSDTNLSVAFFSPINALTIDRSCMNQIKLFYTEIVEAADQNIYGCQIHYGT